MLKALNARAAYEEAIDEHRNAMSHEALSNGQVPSQKSGVEPTCNRHEGFTNRETDDPLAKIVPSEIPGQRRD